MKVYPDCSFIWAYAEVEQQIKAEGDQARKRLKIWRVGEKNHQNSNNQITHYL